MKLDLELHAGEEVNEQEGRLILYRTVPACLPAIPQYTHSLLCITPSCKLTCFTSLIIIQCHSLINYVTS
jgi:hypothetical protein